MLGADLIGLRWYTDRYDVGELFKPGDAASFAAAARRLLEDPERARRARTESRRLLGDVNWEEQADRLVRSYAQMLGRSSPR